MPDEEAEELPSEGVVHHEGEQHVDNGVVGERNLDSILFRAIKYYSILL
jgi:hypothetical protein